MSEFKSGDIVRVIDGHMALPAGVDYVVAYVNRNEEAAEEYVHLVGVDGGWVPERFELVEQSFSPIETSEAEAQPFCAPCQVKPIDSTWLPPTTPLRGEADPTGRPANTPGAKLDAGKVRPALVLGGFARALLEVSKVGTYGATKYTEDGWMSVPNGTKRYDDALMRHYLREKSGELTDPDTGLLHAAHTAWNALARLDLLVREQETVSAD